VAGRVLVTRRVPGSILAKLDASFELDLHDSEEPLERGALLERVRGTAGIVTMVSDGIDAELLDAASPELRVVTNYAVGFDNIDVAAATERRVVVTNTPDVLSRATAELTLALLLALARRVGEGDRLLRVAQPWIWSPTWMIGMGLEGRTLGIVGLGRIGTEVARLATAFAMEVIYASRRGATPGVSHEAVSLDELLVRSDVVSIHCPLTPETQHLIGARELEAMRSDALLVNTARGPVVDEDALVHALRERSIGGAALDVFEREPEVHAGLLELENVVLTPHLGSGTADTREAMGELCYQGLAAVLFEHRCPANALNPEAMR
jgi:glyoxylate reductase